IAYRNHWISAEELRATANTMAKNDYGQYLLNLLDR
ncbi:MAG: glucose-1-phosphate thymidylyltransferase, partial [Bacteroidales bacterium]|nr:glucose-1-phosphate thymidylyltransferase [Bacteroidales bacterium]